MHRITIRQNTINFFEQICEKRVFLISNRESKHYHQIQIIGDSLGTIPNLPKKDYIAGLYFSTTKAKICSFSERNLIAQISSAQGVSMISSQNIYYKPNDHVSLTKIKFYAKL